MDKEKLEEAFEAERLGPDGIEAFFKKHGEGPAHLIWQAAHAHLATLREDKGGDYVLVPRVPTEKMETAMKSIKIQYDEYTEHYFEPWMFKEMYKAALEAALKNPSDAEVREALEALNILAGEYSLDVQTNDRLVETIRAALKNK